MAPAGAGDHASSTIPLRCLICPKRPDFSDVSHLLTHVASKGHLAQQFKVSVRAPTDKAARDSLEQYNSWFRKHGIEQLCANRLRSKEIKKGRGRGGGLVPPAALSVAPSPALAVAGPGSHMRELNGGRFDPAFQLPQSSPTDDGSSFADSLDQCPVWHDPNLAREPRLHLWNTEHGRLHFAPRPLHERSTPMPMPLLCTSFPCPRHGYMAGHGAVYAGDPDFTFPLRSPALDGTTPSVTEAGPSDEASDDAEKADAEKVGGECLLKGALYPGMDVFDAATPQQRRQRNQKKDGSILAQMEQNSKQVRATELIFCPDGDFKREKWLYAPPEAEPEPDLVEHDKPSSRKRPADTPRLALAEVSTNMRRGVGSSKTNRTGGRGGEQRKENRKPCKPSVSKNKTTATRGAPTEHDVPRVAAHLPLIIPESEVRTWPAERPEKRTRMDIIAELDELYRGLRGPEVTSSAQGADAAGVLSDAPLQETHVTGSLPSNPDEAANGRSQPEITSFFKPVIPRCPGKENIPPQFDGAQFCREMAARAADEPETQHSSSEAEEYPPRFFDPSSPIDFRNFNDSAFFSLSANALGMGSFPGHGHQLPTFTHSGPTAEPTLYSSDGADWKVLPSAFSFDGTSSLETGDELLLHGDRH